VQGLQQKFFRRYHTILFGAWLAAWQLFPAPAAWAWDLQAETLHYAVDASVLKDAALVTVSLRPMDGENFAGEIQVETKGLVALCTANQQDRYHTTMRLFQGRLRPLVYIEESKCDDKQLYNEYRFRYDCQRLELWRKGKDGAPVRKWEKKLTATIYDPISAFYNFRLGALGRVKEGRTITWAGIPYPRLETMTIRLGPQEAGNRQATLTIRSQPQEHDISPIKILFDDQLAPQSIRTQIPVFGELSGRLTGRE
jgi:hypothetical protein